MSSLTDIGVARTVIDRRRRELFSNFFSPLAYRPDTRWIGKEGSWFNPNNALRRANVGEIPLSPELFELLVVDVDRNDIIGWSKEEMREKIVESPVDVSENGSVPEGLKPPYYYFVDDEPEVTYDTDSYPKSHYTSLYRRAYDTTRVDIEKAVNYGILSKEDAVEVGETITKLTLRDLTLDDELRTRLLTAVGITPSSRPTRDFLYAASSALVSDKLLDEDKNVVENNKPFKSLLYYNYLDGQSIGSYLAESSRFFTDSDEYEILQFALTRFDPGTLSTKLQERYRELADPIDVESDTVVEDIAINTSGTVDAGTTSRMLPRDFEARVNEFIVNKDLEGILNISEEDRNKYMTPQLLETIYDVFGEVPNIVTDPSKRLPPRLTHANLEEVYPELTPEQLLKQFDPEWLYEEVRDGDDFITATLFPTVFGSSRGEVPIIVKAYEIASQRGDRDTTGSLLDTIVMTIGETDGPVPLPIVKLLLERPYEQFRDALEIIVMKGIDGDLTDVEGRTKEWVQDLVDRNEWIELRSLTPKQALFLITPEMVYVVAKKDKLKQLDYSVYNEVFGNNGGQLAPLLVAHQIAKENNDSETSARIERSIRKLLSEAPLTPHEQYLLAIYGQQHLAEQEPAPSPQQLTPQTLARDLYINYAKDDYVTLGEILTTISKLRRDQVDDVRKELLSMVDTKTYASLSILIDASRFQQSNSLVLKYLAMLPNVVYEDERETLYLNLLEQAFSYTSDSREQLLGLLTEVNNRYIEVSGGQPYQQATDAFDGSLLFAAFLDLLRTESPTTDSIERATKTAYDGRYEGRMPALHFYVLIKHLGDQLPDDAYIVVDEDYDTMINLLVRLDQKETDGNDSQVKRYIARTTERHMKTSMERQMQVGQQSTPGYIQQSQLQGVPQGASQGVPQGVSQGVPQGGFSGQSQSQLQGVPQGARQRGFIGQPQYTNIPGTISGSFTGIPQEFGGTFGRGQVAQPSGGRGMSSRGRGRGGPK